LYDILLGKSALVSKTIDGGLAGSSSYPQISGYGRYVSFYSESSRLVSNDTNKKGDIFVWDRYSNQTKRISIANNGNQSISDAGAGNQISRNGLYAAFNSSTRNMVPGDSNEMRDVFISFTENPPDTDPKSGIDFDKDRDIDGSDLFILKDQSEVKLENFAIYFGSIF
jgi:hypothetical protein